MHSRGRLGQTATRHPHQEAAMNHLLRLSLASTVCRNRIPQRPASSAIDSQATSMHVIRRFATVVLMAFGFAGVGWSNAAHSSLITYTLTGGTIDGTLNGVAFSNASFTMTATADPSAFIIENDSGVILYRQAATTTMTMPGFSPFQITTPTWGPLILDYTGVVPNLWYGGFGARFTSPVETVGATAVTTTGVTGDVINGDGSLAGMFTMSQRTFSTTAGDLVISGESDQGATFISSASAVPEIDPAGMASVLALVTGGLGLLERRRLKAA